MGLKLNLFYLSQLMWKMDIWGLHPIKTPQDVIPHNQNKPSREPSLV